MEKKKYQLEVKFISNLFLKLILIKIQIQKKLKP